MNSIAKSMCPLVSRLALNSRAMGFDRYPFFFPIQSAEIDLEPEDTIGLHSREEINGGVEKLLVVKRSV